VVVRLAGQMPLAVSRGTRVDVGVAQHDRYAEFGREESIQNVQRVEYPLPQVPVWSRTESLRVSFRASMQAGFIGEFCARLSDWILRQGSGYPLGDWDSLGQRLTRNCPGQVHRRPEAPRHVEPQLEGGKRL
jgi:hypothetical protein